MASPRSKEFDEGGGAGVHLGIEIVGQKIDRALGLRGGGQRGSGDEGESE